MFLRYSGLTGPSTTPITPYLCAVLTDSHRVLVDDVDMQGRIGGGGFMTYGIDPDHGAIVVVRPDGYIGTVAPLERVDHVDEYFAGFML